MVVNNGSEVLKGILYSTYARRGCLKSEK